MLRGIKKPTLISDSIVDFHLFTFYAIIYADQMYQNICAKLLYYF